MALDVECIHGLTAQTCTLCKPKPRRSVTFVPAMVKRPFEARYEGFCPVCHEAIEVGDLICHDDEGGYLHDRCQG